jgi:hypothetical protein
MSRRTGLTIALALTLAGMAPPAFAYLDPSTGSMIISAVVGLFASAALAIKTYWYKLRSVFRRRDKNQEKTFQDPGNPTEPERGQ